MISDGEGGAIIAWEDYRNGISGGSDVYAERIDSNGIALWAPDGVPISTAVEAQRFPELASDGAGGAIITWQDNGFIPVTSDYDIFAQRISADGDTLWAKNGIPVCTLGNDQEHPRIVPDGAGGAIIFWTLNLQAWETIFAQRIDPNGTAVWTTDGIPISLSADSQEPQIIPDGRGGTIIAWDGRGFGSYDIYFQHVKADGKMVCPENGLPICTAANNQMEPQITSDDAGGAIVTWYDGRNGNDDIYAAKVPKCGCIATLLQGFNVSSHARDITLEWTLSEAEPGIGFHVLRAETRDGFFKDIDAPAIEQDALCYTFKDKAIEPGVSYRYRVEVSDESGRRVLFETDPITIPAPSLALHQNHPNPFNPATTIGYSLPSASHVTLEIYDVSGRRIARLVNEAQEGGAHAIEWSGLDEKGNPVSSGTYIYRIKAGKEVISRKMILLR